jgi:hypothetical protein
MPTTEFSDIDHVKLERIQLKTVQAVVRILCEAESSSIDVVLGAHRRVIPHFREHLDFLCALEILELNSLNLLVESEYLLDEERLKFMLAEKFLKKSTLYFPSVLSYLGRFQVNEAGRLSTLKKMNFNLRMSGLRDLLLETGVLRDVGNSIEVTTEFENKVESRLRRYAITPRMFLMNLERNRKLGEAAEELVFKAERKRLIGYPHLRSRVERISLLSPGAGYDIKSFSLPLQYGLPSEIYIEVKAVKSTDWRFYWSKNEIAVASDRKENYFLYLVPVIDGFLNVEKIRVIQNPVETVIPSEEWLREVENMSFWQLSEIKPG